MENLSTRTGPATESMDGLQESMSSQNHMQKFGELCIFMGKRPICFHQIMKKDSVTQERLRTWSHVELYDTLFPTLKG